MKQNAVLPRFYIEFVSGTFAAGDELSAVATFNPTTAADGKTAGTFDITATVSYLSDNYDVTVQKGTLTVTAETVPDPGPDPEPSGCGKSAAALAVLLPLALASFVLWKRKP